MQHKERENSNHTKGEDSCNMYNQRTHNEYTKESVFMEKRCQ